MEGNENSERRSSRSPKLLASCHCGAVSQDRLQDSSPDLPVVTALCHCTTCRHGTGLLSTSYMAIAKPDNTSNTTTHPSSSDQTQRYFCSTCGCHMFRSRPVQDRDDSLHDEKERCWEVSTGVLNNVASFVDIERHINVSDTNDGGLSLWIKEHNGHPLPVFQGPGPDDCHEAITKTPSRTKASPYTPSDNNILPATCLCTRVSFHITRPNRSSSLPQSPFPDLMIPYHTRSPLIPNPENQTWWLRADNTKYLAGTCACRSCRLTSGFEIQTWAFVPRVNIVMHVPFYEQDGKGESGQSGGARAREAEERMEVPLDFANLTPTLLKAYESSPGVIRNFCGTCGATVFWHDKWRPEIIDVSVGLLDAPEGARAEDWLEWWGERVSFEENANGRGEGGGGDKGWDLIPALKRGLVAWHKTGRDMELEKER